MNTYDNDNKSTQSESESTVQQKPAAPEYGSANQSNTGTFPYTTQTAAPRYQYPQYQTPPAYQAPAQTQQSSYSWGPGAPQGYYQQPKPAQKKKKGGRFFVKALAAVLACGVVSLGSVGVFAGMIQNGVVNIQSPENAEDTAAFTLYKRVDSDAGATPTATKSGLTTQGVAQKVIPSVVCVQNYQIIEQQNGFFSYFYGMGDEREKSGELSPAGEGSGIILSEDGYIVTNQHVISGADRLSVVTSDGTSYEAELIGEDSQTDLAVIKVNTEDKLTPAEFGSSDDLQVTDQVLAIGNPGGLQFNSSVTIGYVSALNRPVTNGETGFVVNCIQTDAAINPGNSGGPLVNMYGQVVGINSSKIVTEGYEGMGFAIPVSKAQPIINELLSGGYIKGRTRLGIMCREVGSAMSEMYNVPRGLQITEFNEDCSLIGTDAEPGDIIIAIEGETVESLRDVSNLLLRYSPGDQVTLTLYRPAQTFGQKGRELEVEITLLEDKGETQD